MDVIILFFLLFFSPVKLL